MAIGNLLYLCSEENLPESSPSISRIGKDEMMLDQRYWPGVGFCSKIQSNVSKPTPASDEGKEVAK